MPILFEYTDHKKFLRDYYLERKAQRKSFSFQMLASRAGFKSKASLANVISGSHPLAKKKVPAMANALGFNKKEAEYFDALVNFNTAGTVGEREYHFGRMKVQIKKTDFARIAGPQFEYYTQWYHCAVREVVTFLDFKGNYKVLGKAIEPLITAAQARKSVELLKKLGMIRRTPSGKYEQTPAVMTSGDEVKSLALLRYHQKQLTLASRSIERHPREMRDISSITAGLSAAGFKKIKAEVQSFRKHLLAIIEKDIPVETVYQIAIQLYPLSKAPPSWNTPEK